MNMYCKWWDLFPFQTCWGLIDSEYQTKASKIKHWILLMNYWILIRKISEISKDPNLRKYWRRIANKNQHKHPTISKMLIFLFLVFTYPSESNQKRRNQSEDNYRIKCSCVFHFPQSNSQRNIRSHFKNQEPKVKESGCYEFENELNRFKLGIFFGKALLAEKHKCNVLLANYLNHMNCSVGSPW